MYKKQIQKHLHHALMTVAAGIAFIALSTEIQADVIHLLPKVKKLEIGKGSLPLSSPLTISDPRQTPALNLYLTDCGATLTQEGDAAGTPVTVEYTDGIPGAFRHDFTDWPDEEYSLSVTPEGISIKAVSQTGVIRAAQTLFQLSLERDGSLPCVEIQDWPAFKVRGYMHDVGRSFIEYETLLRHIDLLSRFKINTFHWHLTENQAWRFEVNGYPQLTSDASMTRFPGKYYTQEQCTALSRYAAERGVTVIPEIDMPGHSEAFTRAMGFSMQTDEGVKVLKEALRQLAATFPDAPYIHIGADEVALTYPKFLQIMTAYVQNELHRKVVVWNPISNFTITDKTGFDMTTTWHPTGKAVAGIPNIDTRYNYANLNDMFADPVGLFRSTVYHEKQGTKDIVGAISAFWNDRKMATEEDIIRQNGFYTFVLVNSERTWVGNREQYIEQGGAMLPVAGPEFNEFADWEQRFLFYKNSILKDESIPYVRQTNIKWRVTEPMPRNSADGDAVFPPETSEPATAYEYNGKTYGTVRAAGAAVYLRHSWGDKVKALFTNKPTDNMTSYAYTYIYSPTEQTAGAFIEFQTYGRSEVYPAPLPDKWDRKGSDIWINDERIAPPVWIGSTHPGSINREDLLGNQNFTAREPAQIRLKKGWNKVLLKLPYCNLPNIRLNQWMFTFVLTDPEGRNALEGIIYSPDKIMDENADRLNASLDDAEAWVKATFREIPGFYDPALATDYTATIQAVKATIHDELSEEERNAQLNDLAQKRSELEARLTPEAIMQPQERTADGSEMVYYLSTPNRDGKFMTGQGANAKAVGKNETSATAGWKFARRSDNTWDIINYANGTYLSAESQFNTPVYTRSARPRKGWEIKPASQFGLVTITCGNVQLNQTKSSQNYEIYNWGNGNNTTDTGCQFSFSIADDLIMTGVKGITEQTQNQRFSGKVYDLQGRSYPSGSIPKPQSIYISNNKKYIGN